MAKSKANVAGPIDRIADLVEKRANLLELLDLTNAAPRPLAESEPDIARVVAMLASRCEPQLHWMAQSPTGFADVERLLSQQDEDYAQIPAASLLAWIAPDLVTAALRCALEASYSQLPKPMSSAARATEVAKLNRDIASLENEIAATFWAGLEAGVQADVPPISGATLIGLAST